MKIQKWPEPEEFTSNSSKRLKFEALHIELSLLGWLEGDLLFIREKRLSRLEEQVESKFGNSGLLLSEPPPGSLPLYIFYASLVCDEAKQPGYDCSSLTLVWFADSLPADVSKELSARCQNIDWESHAKNGII